MMIPICTFHAANIELTRIATTTLQSYMYDLDENIEREIKKQMNSHKEKS